MIEHREHWPTPPDAPAPDVWELIDRETGRVVRTFSASSVMGRHLGSGRANVPRGLMAHDASTGYVIY